MRCSSCDQKLEREAVVCIVCGEEVKRPTGLRYTLRTLIVLSLVIGLVATFAIPYLVESRRQEREASAIGALKTLAVSQVLFRESDRERDGNLDYATLDELATNGLLDSVLGSGTKRGYVFETTYSCTNSEFIWFATARPVQPGGRYYCTNQYGVIFYTTSEPFRLNSIDCQPPKGAVVLGR